MFFDRETIEYKGESYCTKHIAGNDPETLYGISYSEYRNEYEIIDGRLMIRKLHLKRKDRKAPIIRHQDREYAPQNKNFFNGLAVYELNIPAPANVMASLFKGNYWTAKTEHLLHFNDGLLVEEKELKDYKDMAFFELYVISRLEDFTFSIREGETETELYHSDGRQNCPIVKIHPNNETNRLLERNEKDFYLQHYPDQDLAFVLRNKDRQIVLNYPEDLKQAYYVNGNIQITINADDCFKELTE